MAIRSVVTRGFGNGTFNGTIALVVTRGYAIGEAAAFAAAKRVITIQSGDREIVIQPTDRDITVEAN